MSKVPLHKKLKTKVYDRDDETVVKLYATEIVKFNPVRRFVEFNTGGWQTVTTIRRMNQACRELGIDCGVYQKKHQLYVGKPNGHYELFRNGVAKIYF